MASGRSDLAFSYRSAHDATQSQIELPKDRLILVSTNPDCPLRFDPWYIYIEAGESFGRHHAAAFADADTARLSFGNAQCGLEYLLRTGGSAYLPRRLAQPYLDSRQLFTQPAAPAFERGVYLTVNEAARKAWQWFEPCARSVTGAAAPWN